MEITTTSRSIRHMQFALAQIGWELLSVEADIDSERLRVELRSGDLFVTFDARKGAPPTITRERADRISFKAGRKGDVYRAERIQMRLIGRTRATGMRSGLRLLSNYVADNSSAQRAIVRDVFRPLLTK